MSKELEQAFREFVPSPPMVLEYRLYYDGNGVPITMSSHNHPDGDYIIITKDIYDRANYNGRVVNGKLEIVDITNQVRVQLQKSTSGMPVVAGHASLPVEQGETYRDIEYYDIYC